jgi:hypothetical protein
LLGPAASWQRAGVVMQSAQGVASIRVRPTALAEPGGRAKYFVPETRS